MIAGTGLVNLLWHGLEEATSIPIDYRIHDPKKLKSHSRAWLDMDNVFKKKQKVKPRGFT